MKDKGLSSELNQKLHPKSEKRKVVDPHKRKRAKKTDKEEKEEKRDTNTNNLDDSKRIKIIWDKIEDHLTEIKSPILETLNPPLKEEDIKKFEDEQKIKIPTELRLCYLIHNGQKDGDSLGRVALCHGLCGNKKRVNSEWVGFLPIEQWETPGEMNMENFSDGMTDLEDESNNEEKDNTEGGDKNSDENSDDGEEDGNRIAHGWISFARAEQEEESHGWMLAIAPNNKPKSSISKKILSKRLKQNEVLNWHYQETSNLSDCPRCGTFIDWFEQLANHILTLKEGHANAEK